VAGLGAESHGGGRLTNAREKLRATAFVFLTVAISTIASLVLADIALEVVLQRRQPRFYTNLTPSELSKLPVMTSGTITGSYLDAIVDQPWHEPGKSWIWAGQRDRAVEFLVKGSWNNIGCHDDVDYPISDRPAVLFLGDSFIEAMQLDVRDTFHHRLRQSRFGERFDVWSCGAAGWHPTRAARFLDDDATLDNIPAVRQLSRLRPTYVVYFVFMGNDLRDEAGPVFEDAMTGAPRCPDPLIPSSPTLNGLNGAHLTPPSGEPILLAMLRQVVGMYATKGGSDYRCIDSQLWPYLTTPVAAVEEGWKTMIGGLDRLNRTVTSRGGKLIVAMIEPMPVTYGRFALDRAVRASYPGGKALSFDESLARLRLSAYTSNRGLPFLDVSAVLQACGGNDHYYPADEHFNANGHRCLAGYLEAHRDTLFP